ncbi:MAG: DUF937 domain-containing protein [Saprospiraceae bacterium]|nr:DUF937 domain-containing protein [Saprospiraceae bacterium]MDW8229549.1 DUF937 domain-containing protein [Saprospiraceae bacterium]
MSFIFDQTKEHLHAGLVADAAQYARQEDAPTAAALDCWSAAILAGLSQYVDRPRAMSRIFEGLDTFPADVLKRPEQLLRAGNLAQGDPKDRSGQLLGQLFGERIGAVRVAVAEHSGVSLAAASDLLGIAGPVVLGVLSQRLHKGELSVSGLANLLRAERQRLNDVLPPRIAESLGISLPLGGEEEPLPQTEGIRWGIVLGVCVALGLITLFAFKQCAG